MRSSQAVEVVPPESSARQIIEISGRYYQEGRWVVREYTPENPMLTLLLGAAIGYGIAWVIHHQSWRSERHVPDYARTQRGFKPRRT